ncbi:hypothetical protein PIB30_023102 [Stylosanthes scabra]|uniref:RING-type domain-containing protein n=1 Tax=Stylosanthes scabra TaxID=79078 RepID=A0ABU6Z8Z9_9FABA|nr:hypothetical protein [Stylosanthes scabra]
MPRRCGCFRMAFWPLMLLPYVVPIMGFLLLYIGSGYKHGDSNLTEFIMGLGIFMLLAFLFLFSKFERLLRVYLRENSLENNSIEITRNLRVVPWLDSDDNLMIAVEIVNQTAAQEQPIGSPFSRSARAARLALRALPPAKSFKAKKEEEEAKNNELTGWRVDDYCCICLEEFKNGELIQPLGVCVHEFHSDCKLLVAFWKNQLSALSCKFGYICSFNKTSLVVIRISY